MMSKLLEIKRAINYKTDGSQTGGRYYRTYCSMSDLLPFTVMRPDINSLAIYISKMSSNKREFLSSIIAILAQRLYYATIGTDFYYEHSFSFSNLRAKSGFSRLHHPLYQKTGLESYMNSYPVKCCVGACFLCT